MLFNGSVINVEDVRVGDQLMGDDSKPRTVLSLARGREMMYDIIPTKGLKYTVNKSHILSFKYISTRQYKIGGKKKKYHKGSIVDISIKKYLKLSKM